MQSGGLAGRTRCFVVLTIVVLLVAPAGSAFADAETAQFLLKAGKDHLAKKQYDDALARFAKALQQDPSLAEAHYLSAVASDGKKDSPGALEHYRAFLK